MTVSHMDAAELKRELTNERLTGHFRDASR